MPRGVSSPAHAATDAPSGSVVEHLPVHEFEACCTAADRRLVEMLRAVIPSLLRAERAPGLSIALARHGQTIWHCGFGYADLQGRAPMRPDTIFRAGSVSKPFTAIAVMQLAEAGVLGLDDPVNRYLPFEVANPLGGEVSIRHLLTHRAGLAKWDAAGASLERPEPLEAVLRRSYDSAWQIQYGGADSRLWVDPVDVAFRYSSLGIATLGLVVERANPERLPYVDYVERKILQPLQMHSSQCPLVQDAEHVRADLWERRSRGYLTMGSVSFECPEVFYGSYPAVGFLSTAADQLRLMMAMLNGGSLDGRRILSTESVSRMLTPCREEPVPLTGHQQGLVWTLDDWRGPRASFGHSGAYAYGWRTAAIGWPRSDTAMVVATNHVGCPRRAGELHQLQELVSDWLQVAAPDVEPDLSPDGVWRLSFCRGLLAAEAINGWLGLQRPAGEEVYRAMAQSAIVDPGGESDWSVDGFLAGVRALLAAGPTPKALADLVAGGTLPVRPGDLEQALYELGTEPGKVTYLSYLLKAAGLDKATAD